MARKYHTTAVYLRPDPKFGSLLVSKFINSIMKGGKKSVAQKIVYDAMDIIRERVEEVEPLEVFTRAIENVKPTVEVRSKRVGGANYQVPMEVRAKRRQSLAFRWIIGAARSRKGRPMRDCLAEELLAAFRRDGLAMKKRDEIHRMAEANKAFAHFAWR